MYTQKTSDGKGKMDSYSTQVWGLHQNLARALLSINVKKERQGRQRLYRLVVLEIDVYICIHLEVYVYSLRSRSQHDKIFSCLSVY